MSSNLERRAENLAYCFQEVLTVGERLRANRQHVSRRRELPPPGSGSDQDFGRGSAPARIFRRRHPARDVRGGRVSR